jgi:hypothetical protein
MPKTEDNSLIERFARLYGEIEAFRPTYEAALERREAELTRRTGILPHWGCRTEDEATRHLAAMKIVDEDIGFNDLNETMEALWARLDPVVKIITAAPARNLADLALKANAAATAWEGLWKELPVNLDYPDELIRDLIENVCAVAGIDLAVNHRLSPRTNLN